MKVTLSVTGILDWLGNSSFILDWLGNGVTAGSFVHNWSECEQGYRNDCKCEQGCRNAGVTGGKYPLVVQIFDEHLIRGMLCCDYAELQTYEYAG
ncbi:hypothetical protein Tco_0657639 [Tanacetum coccineum]